MARLAALPDRDGWALSGLIFLLFMATAVPFGFASGLFAWAPTASGLVSLAVIAFFLPALGEELAFRAPLLFAPGERLFVMAAALLAAFVLWHVLNGLVLMTGARNLFTDPRFLTLAAGLGLACSMMTVSSRSLVPAIMTHWVTVIGWKALFGAERFISG